MNALFEVCVIATGHEIWPSDVRDLQVSPESFKWTDYSPFLSSYTAVGAVLIIAISYIRPRLGKYE